MKLPQAEQVVVPRNKVGKYLLNPAHPLGGGKTRFFQQFGFPREHWPVLANALRRHAVENIVAEAIKDDDGTTYLTEGPLARPSIRRPHIRSVRLIETGELAPRLISTYPQLP